MKVLLIWDQCGEGEPGLYVATGDAAERAIKCQGQYLNSTAPAGDAEIAAFSDDYIWMPDGAPRESTEFFRKIDLTDGPFGPFDQIVIAGFLP